jgi:lysozyme
MNQYAVDFIKEHEGCELTAYKDQKGVLTIGYGHTGPDVTEGLVWTQDQADGALAVDLTGAQNSVNRLLHVALTDQSKAALISFVYNLGSGSLAISDALRSINAGDYLTGARQLATWDHIGNTENKGLLIRRLSEAVLFLQGLR